MVTYAILRIVGDEWISLMVTSHALRDVLRVRLPTLREGNRKIEGREKSRSWNIRSFGSLVIKDFCHDPVGIAYSYFLRM
jgi:hypothetical protein